MISVRSEVRRKRQAEDSGVNYKAVYSRVMAVMTTKFNAKELTEEQKANATLAIISTQTMLGSYSFDVLGLEKANLTQDEILQTLQIYQEANNMTDHQSQQIAQLSVDTQVRRTTATMKGNENIFIVLRFGWFRSCRLCSD